MPKPNFTYLKRPAPPQHERYSPFTREVMEMPVATDRALIYPRKPGQTALAVCALCAAATGAARKKYPDRRFSFRVAHVRGVETFAVWRVK